MSVGFDVQALGGNTLSNCGCCRTREDVMSMCICACYVHVHLCVDVMCICAFVPVHLCVDVFGVKWSSFVCACVSVCVCVLCIYL